jgi:hypothetical protein
MKPCSPVDRDLFSVEQVTPASQAVRRDLQCSSVVGDSQAAPFQRLDMHCPERLDGDRALSCRPHSLRRTSPPEPPTSLSSRTLAGQNGHRCVVRKDLRSKLVGCQRCTTPERWRRRAEEMRAIAESLSVIPLAKASIFRTAADYERRAAPAEKRLSQDGTVLIGYTLCQVRRRCGSHAQHRTIHQRPMNQPR